MCKKDWCVRLGQEGVVCMRVWENYLQYLKRGWTRKEVRGNKNLRKKEGGQAGSNGGWHKKGELQPQYEQWLDVDFLNWCIHFQSILEVDSLNWCFYFQTQKYTWSRLSKLIYLLSDSGVCLKLTLWIDVFISKVRSILEEDFLNWCIYVQTQKYT